MVSVEALATPIESGLHGRLDALVRPEFRVDVLVPALQAAIARRPRLADMGAAARADTVVRTDRRTLEDVFAWAVSGRPVTLLTP